MGFGKANGATRRQVVRGLASGLGAAGLAACGSPAMKGDTGAASAGPQNITWSIYGDETTRPAFQAIQDRFNTQHAGKYVAALNLIPGSEYIDKTIASLAGNSPADVFLTYAQYKPAWVKKSLLLDVSDRFKNSRVVSAKMYYQPVVDAVTYKGKQWGTPWGYNAEVMFVVVDRFKERNVALPSQGWTMQDYADLAKKLTDPSKSIFGTSNAANSDGQQMFSLMWNYGKHYWVNEDETKALVNSEPAVEMFRAFQDMQFKDQSIAWSGNPNRAGFGTNEGATAMFINYSTTPYTLAQVFEKSGNSFEWRMTTFPKGPKDQQHFSQGHLWSIAKGHARPDLAWVMTEWLGGMEAEKVWAETGRTPPQVPSSDLWDMYYAKLPPDMRKAAIDFILNTVYKGKAVNFQYWPTYGDCQPIVKAALNDIYGEKQVPPKVAMDDAAQKIDVVLKANH